MRKHEKIVRKTVSIALCAAMTAGNAAAAAAQEIEKDENIYVSLNQDGSVANVYVVNEFTLEEDGTITDYGDYGSVKNLTSEEAIVWEGEKISVPAEKGKFYYQGNLTSREIPWKIGISYKLDGKEISAEELAGQRGNLEIGIRIEENPECKAVFFDNYLLQATVVLDTEKCSGIKAEGATAANVGAERQLVYNIMAGSEKEITITAQVEDFEMEGISFQGVPMAFDIDGDRLDLSELTDKTDEIKDGVKELDDGSKKLADGTTDAYDGAGQLKEGADVLRDGAGSASEGAEALKEGSLTLTDGAQQLQSGVESYIQGAQALNQGVAAYVQGADALAMGAQSLSALTSLGQVHTAVETLYASMMGEGEEGLSLSQGAAALTQGLGELQAQVQALSDSAGEEELLHLSQGLSKGAAAAGELSAAASDAGKLLSGCAEAVESITGYHAQVMENLNVQAEGLSQKAADQVNAKIDEINGELAAYEDSLNGKIDAGLALVDSYGEGHEDLAAIARQMAEAARPDGFRVSYIDASAIDASVAMPEEEEGIRQILTQLQEGAAAMETAAQSFEGACAQLNDLADAVSAGGSVTAMADLLDAITQAYSAAADVEKGIQQAGSAVGQLEERTRGLEAAGEGVAALQEGFSSLTQNSQSLLAGSSALAENGDALQEAASAVARGAGQVDAGVAGLLSGTAALKSGADQLDGGAGELLEGMRSLEDGTKELAEGTAEFKAKTEDIDVQIEDKVDEVLDEIAGGDFEPVSFTSEENTGISLVQFAIKTDGIRKEEAKAEEPEPEKESVFDKWKDLFANRG